MIFCLEKKKNVTGPVRMRMHPYKFRSNCDIIVVPQGTEERSKRSRGGAKPRRGDTSLTKIVFRMVLRRPLALKIKWAWLRENECVTVPPLRGYVLCHTIPHRFRGGLRSIAPYGAVSQSHSVFWRYHIAGGVFLWDAAAKIQCARGVVEPLGVLFFFVRVIAFKTH
jgi:hypothetical protein